MGAKIKPDLFEHIDGIEEVYKNAFSQNKPNADKSAYKMK